MKSARRPIVPLAALTALVTFSFGLPAEGSAGGSEPVPRICLSGGAGAPSAALHGADRGPGEPSGWAKALDPGLSEGEPIYFDLEPTTIPLKGSGPIRVRNLLVLGDVPLADISLRPGGPERRFERQERRVMEGEVVSVFDLTFPGDDLYAAGPPPVRFDGISRALEDTTGFLRLRQGGLPKTRVVRIDDRVQYSSHVVNIVMPYDGLSVFSFPGREVAAEFYRHFSDSYEELAFVPERLYWSPYFGARHQFVYQDVGGIGLSRMDERPLYGGSGLLRDWIFYIRGDVQSNFISLHETGHNWGWFISLFDAAGLVPSGATECAGLEYDGTSVHAPLFGDRHTFLSQCIWSPLYLKRQGDGLRIAKARPPLAFHPLTLYAMGLLEADAVPPMAVSSVQSHPASLAPGAEIPGELTTVTMEDVQRRYGPRTGPTVPPVWRRAVIVVSPERLLDKADLRWFNYWVKRVSDPEATGVESLAGVPSMEVATRGRVDLQTEIRPRAHPRIGGRFEVSYPGVGKKDVRGLKLRRALGSYYEAGRIYRISGKVRLAGRHETVDVRIGARAFSAAIDPRRGFVLEIELAKRDRGRHWLEIGLDGFERVLGRVAPVYVE